MKEWVGKCQHCRKDIYCKDGFIEALVQDDHSLLCLECAEAGSDKPPHPLTATPSQKSPPSSEQG